MAPGTKGRHRLVVAVAVVGLLVARGLGLVALLEGRRLLERGTEVTALRLDAALQTFRPADHAGLAKPISPDELAEEPSVRSPAPSPGATPTTSRRRSAGGEQPGATSAGADTVSRIWNDPVTVITRTSARIGRSSGSVIRQNDFHSVLPSTAAASYT